MPGLIVLEGPDGAGKTTLGHELRRRHGARYFHCTNWRKMWSHQVGALRLAAKLSREHLVVLDRHWISECCYGPELRGGSPIFPGVRSLARHLDFLNALYVICLPPYGFAEKEFTRLKAGRVELVEKTATFHRIYDRYADGWWGSITRGGEPENHWSMIAARRVAGDYPINMIRWWHYDRTRHDVSLFATHAAKQAHRLWEHRHPWTNQYPWGALTGNPFGKVLLVSDRANADRPMPPFMANVNSSAFFNERLTRGMVDDEDVCLFNIHDAGAELQAEVLNGPWQKVVALGAEAHATIRKHGKNPVCLSHPQYARRFQHKGDYHLELRQEIYGR